MSNQPGQTVESFRPFPSAQPVQASLTDRHKAIVRAIHEGLSQGDLSVLEPHPGLAPMREWFPLFLRAFPDIQTVTEELVAEGDWVAYRLVNRGTHLGEWRGCSPTGQALEFEVNGMYRFAAGRIVQAHGQANLGDVMRQVG
jgi:predicted ester cyclase